MQKVKSQIKSQWPLAKVSETENQLKFNLQGLNSDGIMLLAKFAKIKNCYTNIKRSGTGIVVLINFE